MKTSRAASHAGRDVWKETSGAHAELTVIDVISQRLKPEGRCEHGTKLHTHRRGLGFHVGWRTMSGMNSPTQCAFRLTLSYNRAATLMVSFPCRVCTLLFNSSPKHVASFWTVSFKAISIGAGHDESTILMENSYHRLHGNWTRRQPCCRCCVRSGEVGIRHRPKLVATNLPDRNQIAAE